jgi:hypothetical protein
MVTEIMRTRRPITTEAATALGVALLAAIASFACDRSHELARAADQAPAVPSATAAVEAPDAAQQARIAELEAQVAALGDQVRARDVALQSAAARSCEELECEVADLKAELIGTQEQRLTREREWLRYTEAMRAIPLAAVADEDQFQPQAPPEKIKFPAPEPPPDDSAAVARCAAIARSLRTLLAIEGVRGIDLLEAGELGSGCIGPVVFRLLDDRGRLSGSMTAQRLRLEGSRSARTLTIVLEDGYESRGGERLEFERDVVADASAPSVGVRRLSFPDIDPMPWVEAVPELFGGALLDDPKDDGLWNVDYVRGTLNRLLREDAAHGYWRVKSVLGIEGLTLREVHLEGFDKDGKLERHLFADRMTLVREEKGAMLLLEDGAQARGSDKTAFLDGRFRIFLPRAVHTEWEAAGLPGWSAPPKSASSATTPPAARASH